MRYKYFVKQVESPYYKALDLNAYKCREASKQFYDNVAAASGFESKREEFFLIIKHWVFL